ncbi:MAG: replication-associated recombination protein A [Solirubrobacteraceae bacterium]
MPESPADAPARGDAPATADAPLAARLRPRRVEDVVGQAGLLDEGRPLRASIDAGRPHAMLLHGPPGSGKTTLARIVADAAGAAVERLQAVDAGKAEVRAAIARAQERRASGGATVLFIDEIHRFNRTQQDALLPAVEDGVVTLIAATTEPPWAAVSPALRSRLRIYRLRALDEADVLTLLRRAVAGDALGEGVAADEAALSLLAARSAGDARTALGALEAAVGLARAQIARLLGEDEDEDEDDGPPAERAAVGGRGGGTSDGEGPDVVGGARAGFGAAGGADGTPTDGTPGGGSDHEAGERPRVRPVTVTPSHVAAVLDRSVVAAGPDQPHDLLSAYIKSIRGSDPDAAVYYLAGMLAAGEDPRTVARRLVVSASEDVGLADPHALPMAVAAAEVVDRVGMPECRIALSHVTIRLALAPKSSAAYRAIDDALAQIEEHGVAAPPPYLRGKASDGAAPGHYDYPHTNPGGVSDQELMPAGLEPRRFLVPAEHEQALIERLAATRRARRREP